MNDPITSDQQAHDGLPDESADISPGGLRAAVIEAAAVLIGAAGDGAQGPPGEAFAVGSRGGITLERPPRPDFGDYSTNAALLLAPRMRRSPREVAEQLGAQLASTLGPALERFDVAGPGFVNLHLADRWLRDALAGALAAGGRFGGGSGAVELGDPVLIEFVSANPTGPMHVGHARNAAYGDALARLLEFRGERVTREFYINDAGSQVRVFGASVQAVARGEDPPEGGYQGDYVAELAARLDDAAGADPEELGRAAVSAMIGEIQASLVAFAVKDYDRMRADCTKAIRARWRTRCRCCKSSVTPTRARARCGCARASSAMTRTAYWSARPASTPTSPRTSPTTRTSASAASRASSTSGAPTTTATCGA